MGEEVDVIFEVNETNRPHITDRSVARLGSVSLLGESAVDISPVVGRHADPRVGLRPARAPGRRTVRHHRLRPVRESRS